MTGEELLKELPADPRGLDEWIASQAEHGYIIKEQSNIASKRIYTAKAQKFTIL